MIPYEYGLSGYSPEAIVAIAAEDLIRKVDKNALHANGVGCCTP